MASDKLEMPSKCDDSLLARGELALKAIQLRKRAAEFEAVAAELESAVLAAKQGQDRRLATWMERYGDSEYALLGSSLAETALSDSWRRASIERPHAQSATPHPPTEIRLATKDQTHIANAQASPWSEMLAGAEARSFEIASNPESRAAGEPHQPLKETTNRSNHKAKPLRQKDKGSKSKTASDAKSSSTDVKPANPESDSGGEPQTAEIVQKKLPQLAAAALDVAAVERQKAVLAAMAGDEDKKSKPKLHWAWIGSSWGSSLVVHILIVIGLFVVTIKMAEDKVLSIASASVASPEVLMEQPVEFDPQLPEELSDEMPAEAISQLSSLSSVDVATSLPESVVGTLSAAEPAPTASSAVAKMVNMSGASSKLANVQFFGVQAEGNNFCYVVDNSGSMKRDGAFDAAKAELMRSLASMKPTQRYFIFFFSEEVDALTFDGKEPERYPVYATPENLQKTLAWVQRIPIRGGRPPNDALDQAIEMDPDAIFLLFDGDTSVDVAAHLAKSNRAYDIISGTSIRVPIHTIGFYTQKFEALMKRIAEENKGTYRFVPKPPGKK